MAWIKDQYKIIYNGKTVGYYYVFNDGKFRYSTDWGSPWDIEKELKALGLDKETEKTVPVLEDLIQEKNRIKERRQRIYEEGSLRAERRPEPAGERYLVYSRSAEKGEPG